LATFENVLTERAAMKKISASSVADDAPYWDEDIETLDWEKVEQWQVGQLGQQVESLRHRSAMYRQLLEDLPTDINFRAFRDLQRLPFTMKEDVRRAQDLSTADLPFGANQAVPTSDVIQILSSSGTTGAPVYYAMTAKDSSAAADATANTFYTAGVRRTDIVAHLVALPMLAGGLPYADGFRRIGATLCWLGGFPTERILREMKRLRVTALLATTSFGQYLAEEWAAGSAAGEDRPVLSKVLCGGEPGLDQPEIRRKILNGLGINHLRETMGLGDIISGMWAECEFGEGMHFNAQRHVAVELIEPETGAVVPWSDGACGEIVYTALAREATPLVRYRSRDHVTVTAAGRCACGRTSPRIRCIGRTDDMLIYKGMNVFPTAIREIVMSAFGDVLDPAMRVWKDYAGQIRFDTPITVDLEALASVDAATYPDLASRVEELVRTRLQVRIQPTVLRPGSLPRSMYKNSLLAVRDSE
jgi:phenylacetate-coenzyme A ligase PaaK-like adenylate-forming protein